MKVYVKEAMLFLNNTNFFDALELSTFDTIINQIKRHGEPFLNELYEQKGLLMLRSWIARFSYQNQTGAFNDTTKYYCGRMMSFLKECLATNNIGPSFPNQMIETGLQKDMINFIFSPILFNDTEFSHDMLTSDVLFAEMFFDDGVRSDIINLTHDLFGRGLQPIVDKYRDENISLLKLLLPILLIPINNNSEIREADANEFSLTCPELLNLKSYIFSQRSFGDGFFYYHLKIKFSHIRALGISFSVEQ